MYQRPCLSSSMIMLDSGVVSFETDSPNVLIAGCEIQSPSPEGRWVPASAQTIKRAHVHPELGVFLQLQGTSGGNSRIAQWCWVCLANDHLIVHGKYTRRRRAKALNSVRHEHDKWQVQHPLPARTSMCLTGVTNTISG